MSVRVRLEVSSLATPQFSGVGHYTRLLGEALARDETVALDAPYFNFLGRQPRPDVTFASALRPNPLFPLRVYAKLQSLGIAPPFDLFLRRADLTIFPNFAAWPTVKSRKTAVVVHDLTYVHYPDVVEAANLAHLRRVVPRAVHSADTVITVSEAMKSEIVAHFKLDPARCVVTPVPPDESFFVEHDDVSLDKVREKYGVTQKYIYFLGNREPRKDIPTLVAAYGLLPAAVREAYALVIAGGKGWKSQAADNAIASGIKAELAIKTLGYIDQADSPFLYAAASVVVMPSVYEGFGMPVLEALASGTPVVASDIPVFREVGGNAVRYASAGDANDLATVINDVLDTTIDRSVLRLQARRVSWDKNVQTIKDIVVRP